MSYAFVLAANKPRMHSVIYGFEQIILFQNEKTESPTQEKNQDIDGVALFKLGLPDDDDVDGAPIQDDAIGDVDGMPLEAAENIDGIPRTQRIRIQLQHCSQPLCVSVADDKAPVKEPAKGGVAPRFVQSKWETVDPQDVEAQAMTTSKWEQLESKDDVDGVPLEDSFNDSQADRTVC